MDNRNMNILLLAPQPFFQHRGTPIAVKLLAQVLGSMGHRVHLLTYHEGENISLPNVRISRIPSLPGIKGVPPGFSFKKIICDLIMFFKCLQMLKAYKFDIVHAIEESVFIAILLKYLFGIPYIYDMDSSMAEQLVEKYPFLGPFLPLFEIFEKIAVRESTGVLAVCKALENKALRFNPRSPVQRLEDISLLPQEKVETIEEPKRINTAGPVIMYIGNLEKYQGVDLLVESFSLAVKTIAHANLVIIGGKAADIAHYKKVSEKLGIIDKTMFTGPRPVSDLHIYLSQADILVSPRIKGFNTPMKIYSYLDSGKAVLATRLYTHTQVLDDEISFLVAPNANAMAAGMIELLKNKNLRRQLGENAKERIQAEYCYSAYERKLAGFYNTIAA